MSVFGCAETEPDPKRSDASAELAQAADGAVDAGAAAPKFEIAFSTSECEAQCSAYDLKLDQSGSVSFYGHRNTRLQGWFGKMVSEETASQLLDRVVATNYGELRDTYRETSDGCRDVEPARETHTWNVSMGGPAKIVVDYQGCHGVSELEELRKLPVLFVERLGLATYLEM